MRVTSSLETVLTPTAVALGNFDGVHQGHRQVIQPILNLANSGPETVKTVVTFNPHPQEFFSGQPRRLLTPLAEKVVQLSDMGVEQLVLLPFDRELARLSPEQFVATILVAGLQARLISVGADFCFGQGRTGTAADLKAIAATHGVEVAIAILKCMDETRISSSAIRQALLNGETRGANRLLGRSYRLVGEVVQGQQIGRTLGFPTANLQLPTEKFLPCLGVYAVRVQVCERVDGILRGDAPLLPGVMNLGHRPTLSGTQLIPEIHLFDWSGDLYGRVLAVHLEDFIRREQKFGSLDDLKAQIYADCEMARSLLG
ncbi:MAG: bifunctional riboflavin kinase/FAD synthetase [Leptolyngbyaceae cyanobacterium bins.349]|nr:bifunctional riboflavin kinase/FAD synthetase [Leptolyngbyaceae cyanobacterium bins.349]